MSCTQIEERNTPLTHYGGVSAIQHECSAFINSCSLEYTCLVLQIVDETDEGALPAQLEVRIDVDVER